MRCHLLEMPTETRLYVYRHLLTGSGYIFLYRSGERRLHRIRDKLIGFPIYPAIMRTNRQVHEETSEVLYGDNVFLKTTSVMGFDPYHESVAAALHLPYYRMIKHLRVSLSILLKPFRTNEW